MSYLLQACKHAAEINGEGAEQLCYGMTNLLITLPEQWPCFCNECNAASLTTCCGVPESSLKAEKSKRAGTQLMPVMTSHCDESR